MNDMKKSRRLDIRFGFEMGAGMAVVYSAAAALIYFASSGEAFEANNVTLPEVLVAYWVGGIGSGLLLGLLMPIARSRRSAVLVGPIVAMPAVAMICVAIEGFPWTWTEPMVFTFVTASLAFGMGFGYYFGGGRRS